MVAAVFLLQGKGGGHPHPKTRDAGEKGERLPQRCRGAGGEGGLCGPPSTRDCRPPVPTGDGGHPDPPV